MNSALAKRISRDTGLCRGIFWLYPPPAVWKPLDLAAIKQSWRAASSSRAPIDLHLNIPFAVEDPVFCDYAHVVEHRTSEYDSYIGYLEREADRLQVPDSLHIRRFFLTGGSATVLRPSQVHRIFDFLRVRFNVERPDSTIEIDHCPAPLDTLREFAAGGVKRAILGVQTLDPALAKELRWNQTPKSLADTVNSVRRAGIPLLRINLYVGIPGQSESAFMRDLRFILSLDPDSVVLQPFSPANHAPLSKETPPLCFPSAHRLAPGDILRRTTLFNSGRQLIGEANLPGAGREDWSGGFVSQLCLGFGSISRIRGKLIYRSGLSYEDYCRWTSGRGQAPIVGFPMNRSREMRSYTIRAIECPGIISKPEFKRLFSVEFLNAFKAEFGRYSHVFDARNSVDCWDVSHHPSLKRSIIAKFFYESSVARRFQDHYRLKSAPDDEINQQLLQLYCLEQSGRPLAVL